MKIRPLTRLTAVVLACLTSFSIPAVAHPLSGRPRRERSAPAHSLLLSSQTTASPAACLPLAFEQNVGQTDGRVSFLARGERYTVFLSPTEVVYAPTNDPNAVRVSLAGASERASVAGESLMGGRRSYVLGSDPSEWHRDVPTFARVRCARVYPGIDVVYYGNARDLEYDFIVAPNARPERIALEVDGATGVRIDADGDLVIATAGGEMRHRRPTVYQTVDGERRAVTGRFEMRADGSVGFDVGAYDRSRPLTIDPSLSYSTYLGGSSYDFAYATATGADGATYLTGATGSTDFPFASVLPGSAHGKVHVFVAKLSPAGDAVEYALIVGGSGDDFGEAIAVRPDGAVVVSGFTTSTDFPMRRAAQPAYGGGARDAMVLEIDASGTALVFSTFLGGSGEESCPRLALDARGNVYAAGYTSSANLPVANAFQAAFGGADDGLLAKYGSDGALVSSTFLGGAGEDFIGGLAIDPEGAVYVGMTTDSADLPVVGAIHPSPSGDYDGYVAKLSPSGTSLVYSTYFGGSAYDEVDSVCVDPLGSAYVLGSTKSGDFPTVTPFQPRYAGGSHDATIAKINPEGTATVYASYLGGSGDEYLSVLQIDALGSALVAGSTSSTDFPTVSPIQATRDGSALDAVAARIGPRGDRLDYATYLGGTGIDSAHGGAVDANGNFILALNTTSTNFPTSLPFQPALAGQQDLGLVKLANRYTLTWSAPASDQGAPVGLDATLAETGDAAPFTPPTPAADASPAGVTGYRVYRSSAPHVEPVARNLFAELSRDATSVDASAPGGCYYVVTAVTSTGAESRPSNEAAAGAGPGPALAKVAIKPSKIVAKGARFTREVQVFLDGIPFASPATIKQGKKVTQTGALVTGLTVAEHLAAHGNRAIVALRNSDGGIATFVLSR